MSAVGPDRNERNPLMVASIPQIDILFKYATALLHEQK